MLLHRGMVDRALKDAKFKSAFPEFNSLLSLKAAPAPGCPTCARRKSTIEPNVQLAVFASIIASLGKQKLAAIKKYFNTDVLQYRVDSEVKTL